MTTFSERHGYTSPEAPIKVREGDPGPLRQVLWRFAMKATGQLGSLADLVLKAVYFPNYSPHQPIIGQAEQALLQCPWYQVYEAAEGIYDHLIRERGGAERRFEDDLNHFMRDAGIGWQMVGGRFEVRGAASFEDTVHCARAALVAAGNITAEGELREALKDLSRRPEPDITGAIQHAGAALECLARDLCGDTKKSYGELMRAYPDRFPKPPLGMALEKVWGFASEKGRHLREGEAPSFNEAMLVVGLVASAAAYLVNENKPKS
jgi:hypothetical protein